MPNYEIYVFCNECGMPHPTRIKLSLPAGPAQKQSIDDVYAGEKLPSEIAKLKDNYFQCPETGKLFEQKDNEQVFLVPIGQEDNGRWFLITHKDCETDFTINFEKYLKSYKAIMLSPVQMPSLNCPSCRSEHGENSISCTKDLYNFFETYKIIIDKLEKAGFTIREIDPDL